MTYDEMRAMLHTIQDAVTDLLHHIHHTEGNAK